MTDDQGWGDIRSHGNDLIDTPVLDELASSGARFDRFFVSPVCAPTRASLLTGRYFLRTGVHGVTRGHETMRSEEVTLAELLKEAGYATGCFGKWHNGAHYPYHPNGQGFDEFLGFCAGHWNNYFDTRLERDGKPIDSKGYIADVLTDAAIDFIERNRENAFFCYLPYNTPHSPWQVPDRLFEKYQMRGLDPTTACAYGMVENVDQNVGRLLEVIDWLDLARETIVVFLTDNGANSDRFNGGMRGRKGSLHEGGGRVPFFIRWPGRIRPGLEISQIAAHIDLLPTLAELCGIGTARLLPLDGVSLVPLLEGGDLERPGGMLFQYWKGGAVTPERGAVRTGRWRAVKNESWQLFDMLADPREEIDVASDNPQIVADLSQAFDHWFQDVTKQGFDTIAMPVGHPNRPRVELPGHEALLHPGVGDGISYHGRAGWANDWIDNWVSAESYPYWEVDVVRAGRFEVALLYGCSEADIGSRIRVEVGGQSLEGVVTPAHVPEVLNSPDRVPRKEVYERTWVPLRMGILEIPAGRTTVRIRAVNRTGSEVMELKAVILQAVTENSQLSGK
jgi:arylsulfatase A